MNEQQTPAPQAQSVAEPVTVTPAPGSIPANPVPFAAPGSVPAPVAQPGTIPANSAEPATIPANPAEPDYRALYETLRRENEILRQNAEATQRAPVQGVSGGGSVAAPVDDFIRGFDSDTWD